MKNSVFPSSLNTMPNSKNIDELHEFIAKQQFDNITDEDWETLLAVLSEKRDWEQMWRLAQISPMMWSVRLLLQLKEAAWMPQRDVEQSVFNQLTQLAKECNEKELDHLIGGLVHCHTILEGHSNEIDCIATSPDGRFLASTSGDRIVRLWNLPEGTLLHTLAGSDHYKLTFSPDGQILISEGRTWCEGPPRGYSYEIRSWQLPDGILLNTLERFRPLSAISSNEQMLAIGSHDNSLLLWRLPDGTLVNTLEGANFPFAISFDGQMLASGSHNNTIKLWSLPDGAPLKTLLGPTNKVNCIEISPDGRLLASGSVDSTLQLWSLPEGELLHTLDTLGETQENWINLTISPDGRVLISTREFLDLNYLWIGEYFESYATQLWRLPDGVLLNTLKGVGPISPDGQLLLLSHEYLPTRFCRLPKGRRVNTLEGSNPPFIFSSDGRVLITGSNDNTVQLWQLPDGTKLQTLEGHTDAITCLAISPDEQILASGSRDGSVRLWAIGMIDVTKLKPLIVGQTGLKDLRFVKDTLATEDENISTIQQVWLEFILVLMRRHLSVQALNILDMMKRSVPVATCSVEEIELLMQACQDAEVAEVAVKACDYLVRLDHAEAIDVLCSQWMDTREPTLAQAISQSGYVARQPLGVRVFSALKAGKLDLLKKGEAEEVVELLKASEDIEPDIADRARQVLSQLRRIEAQESLCQFVIDHEYPLAREAALAGGYLPRDTSQRALFLFITEQWDHYEAFDFDRTLLRMVYTSASPELRQRITEKLRQAGRTDFLTVLVGADYHSLLEDISPTETEVLVHLGADNQEWTRLWTLVFELPFAWSLRIMKILNDQAWQPERDDERTLFRELSTLASNELVTSEKEIRQVVLPLILQEARISVHGRVNDLAFSHVRPVLAIGTGARKIALWDFQRGEMEQVLKGFNHAIGVVTFLPDGTLLCGERTNTTTRSCAIYAWSESQLVQLGQHEGSVTALQAVDENRVLSTGRDEKIILWDVATGRKLREQRLAFWARAARTSHDGQYVALLHKGVTIMRIPQLDRFVDRLDDKVSRCAAFVPHEHMLVVGRFNGEVLVYEYSGSDTLSIRQSLPPHRQRVQGVAALPQNETIVSVGAEGTMHVTTWTDWSSPGSIELPDEGFTSLHVSPDGAFMATGHSDTSFSLWDLRTLNIPPLFTRPFAHASLEQFMAVRALAANLKLEVRLRHTLTYIKRVLEHRFRFAVEIEDIPTIKFGEFDIEIDT